jgi:hypothetical protein
VPLLIGLGAWSHDDDRFVRHAGARTGWGVILGKSNARERQSYRIEINPGTDQPPNAEGAGAPTVTVGHKGLSPERLRTAIAPGSSGTGTCVALHVDAHIRAKELAGAGEPRLTCRCGGATRARDDDGGAGAGAAGDAMHAHGLQRVDQMHRRQNGGQPARQPRLPHPQWPQEEHMMLRTPPLSSHLSWHLQAMAAMPVDVAPKCDDLRAPRHWRSRRRVA